MKKDYVPTRDGDKLPWASTLKSKIGTLGAGLGFTGGEITDVQNACDGITANINDVNAARDAFQALVSDKRAQNLVHIRVIRAAAQRAKTYPTYTDGIGQQLGIVGDERTIDIANAKPDFQLFKDPSGWRLEFNLKDFFDGVNIYKAIEPNGNNWRFLARDTSSPYIDTEPVAPGTRYRGFYVIGDTEVGLVSNEVVINI